MSWNSQSYSRMQRAEGRLVWNPTDLSAAFPFGGTDLGRCVDKVLRFQRNYRDVTAEEFGGDIQTTVELGGPTVFACMVMGVVDNAYDLVMTSANGDTYKVFSNTETPGGEVSGQPLLFYPNDPTNHEALLVHHALPTMPPDAAQRFAIDERLGLPLLFRCARDPETDKVYDLGIFGDLSL